MWKLLKMYLKTVVEKLFNDIAHIPGSQLLGGDQHRLPIREQTADDLRCSLKFFAIHEGKKTL
jgi:hypothetical protein